MGLFNFLRKKEIVNFKIDTSMLDDPSNFDDKTHNLVKCLSSDEFKILYTTCKNLQTHIDSLIHFWQYEGLFFTKELMQRDKSVVYKSCFELLMLDWVVITQEFTKKSVREEVGDVLWFLLYDSLIQSYPNIFNEKTFPSYQQAIESRAVVYEKLLKDLFSGNSYQLATQNLYVIITQIPMKVDTSDIEKSRPNSIFINGIISLDAMGNFKKTITFNEYFDKSFPTFLKAMNKKI